MARVEKPCAHCGQSFMPKRAGIKYCSRSCVSSARGGGMVELTCSQCGDRYSIIAAHNHRNRAYCSTDCYKTARKAGRGDYKAIHSADSGHNTPLGMLLRVPFSAFANHETTV